MMQPALHPSLVTMLPSSQASLDAFFPSPHIVTVQTLGWALVQVKPHSTEQLDEHPSPLSVSPSSHISVPTALLSPHTGVNVLLPHPGKMGVHPSSFVQTLLHPSPLTLLPSSQGSSDASPPSPQDDEHESGAVGLPPVQLKPHSTVQVAEHPSLDPESLSSHSSEPALYPSSQTVLHVD
jgi:hypothetical protein